MKQQIVELTEKTNYIVADHGRLQRAIEHNDHVESI
jgi:hypothetical protein